MERTYPFGMDHVQNARRHISTQKGLTGLSVNERVASDIIALLALTLIINKLRQVNNEQKKKANFLKLDRNLKAMANLPSQFDTQIVDALSSEVESQLSSLVYDMSS